MPNTAIQLDLLEAAIPVRDDEAARRLHQRVCWIMEHGTWVGGQLTYLPLVPSTTEWNYIQAYTRHIGRTINLQR